MKHEPELNDYTPENVSGATLFGGGIILVLIVIAVFFAVIQNRKGLECVYIHDTEMKKETVRLPAKVYVSIEGQRFSPGSKLTSSENGDFIIWDSTTPTTWIIGVVTDSGTIDYSPFEIKPE